MGDISRRLSRWEFACKCGCGFNAVDITLVNILEDIADNFQSKYGANRCYIKINCACRCVEHNEKVKTEESARLKKHYIPYSSKSMHISGMAVDFYLVLDNRGNHRKVDPSEVADYIESKYPNEYGVGRYVTFTHVDVRSKKARW